ncbi:MAG: DUF2155 domain-containing protein [Rickettsiales bacterium]|nr:DUF2155 domain-containing protein [Rickettsiales bacterium]
MLINILEEIMKENVEASTEENFIKNQSPDRFVDTVQIRILNKTTGKTFELERRIGDEISVEDLDIKFIKCWKSYPEETPENKLLLKVYETKDKYLDRSNLIFFGWIFSSSPSLNGLEHPSYDITLENCKNSMQLEN